MLVYNRAAAAGGSFDGGGPLEHPMPGVVEAEVKMLQGCVALESIGEGADAGAREAIAAKTDGVQQGKYYMYQYLGL